MMMKQRDNLKHVKRIVLKVGSSLLADAKHGVNTTMVQRLAQDIKALHDKNIQVCLVSSGAVALGRVQLGWLDKKLNVHEKQAAAAIGQPLLMHAYQQAFSDLGLVVAQMLLTKDDLRHRRRYINASNTSKTLFAAGVVPIVNENDTVVVEEIKFGDNDALGALVSTVVEADLLVMMTDVDGLFDTNPADDVHAKRLSQVQQLTANIMDMAGDKGSSFGTGGMKSKLDAAKIATQSGVTAAIINGQSQGELLNLLDGEDVGTIFSCNNDRQSWHKHWISHLLTVSGKLMLKSTIDTGENVMLEDIKHIQGQFDKGECVELWLGDVLLGRGLTNYAAEDMQKLIGLTTQDIERTLGYVDFKSMVHKDNLVILGQTS
jgi:glutamate 5-kinase